MTITHWPVGVPVALLLATALGTGACSDDCEGDGCVGGQGSGASGASGGAGGSTSSLADQYCNCMLGNCHDEYHAHFGPDTDEPAAAAACLAEAESLALAGMDVAQGNFLECRIHYCQLGGSDESLCPASIGEGACSDGGMGGAGGGSGGSGGSLGTGGSGGGGGN